MKIHANTEVSAALVRLNDVLCTLERNTGQQTVLILRDASGYVHRSLNGKPITEDEGAVPDSFLFGLMVDDGDEKREPVMTGVLEQNWIVWANSYSRATQNAYEKWRSGLQKARRGFSW